MKKQAPIKICIMGEANSIHIIRWCTFFKEKGHSVYVIDFLGDVSDVHTNPPKVPEVYTKLGIPVHVIPEFMNLKNLFQRTPFRKIITAMNLILKYSNLLYIIHKIKPDVIHGHYLTNYGYWAAKTKFHPLVLSIWGSDILSYPSSFPKARRDIEQTMVAADVITCATHNMFDIVQREYKPGNKLKLVRWGIDTQIFFIGYKEEVAELRKHLKIPPASPVILSARGMKEVYGNNYLLEAIPEIIKHNPNIYFVFIRGYGNEQYEGEIKSRAKELGVTNNLRFVEPLLNPIELAVYMNLADMSTSFVPFGQFGGVQLESMNCGCVQLASDIEVHREKLTHMVNALLVNRENKHDISEIIKYYLKHPEIKEIYYKINHELVEETESWQKNADSMIELYYELIRNQK